MDIYVEFLTTKTVDNKKTKGLQCISTCLNTCVCISEHKNNNIYTPLQVLLVAGHLQLANMNLSAKNPF